MARRRGGPRTVHSRFRRRPRHTADRTVQPSAAAPAHAVGSDRLGDDRASTTPAIALTITSYCVTLPLAAPPSTSNPAPVIHDATSDVMNTIILAISSGVP